MTHRTDYCTTVERSPYRKESRCWTRQDVIDAARRYREWANALPGYTQGRSYLYTIDPKTGKEFMCCLGVETDRAIKDGRFDGEWGAPEGVSTAVIGPGGIYYDVDNTRQKVGFTTPERAGVGIRESGWMDQAFAEQQYLMDRRGQSYFEPHQDALVPKYPEGHSSDSLANSLSGMNDADYDFDMIAAVLNERARIMEEWLGIRAEQKEG